MKKILYFALSLASAFLAFSCGSTDRGGECDTDTVIVDSLDTLTAKDSLFSVVRVHYRDSLYGSEENAMAVFDVTIDVPHGPACLVEAINRWIAAQLNHKDSIGFSEDDLAVLSAEYLHQEGLKPTSRLCDSICMVYHTDRYVSYEIKGNESAAGENPLPHYAGVTFDKTTGAELSDSIFSTTDGLGKLLKKHIFAAYSGNPKIDFEELLFENMRSEFALPVNPAWLVDSGVRFSYGAYEIAPYSAGTPTCTIPYRLLRRNLGKSISY